MANLRLRAAVAVAGIALLCSAAWSAETAGKAALFERPAVLRGTLGDQEIQASIRPKAAPDVGIEGQYFLFGRGQIILLAGEAEDEEVLMEESANGTDVSGQWDGVVEGDTFRGTWRSAEGELVLPFTLKEVRMAPTREKPRDR
jgi:hypothetical protein